MLYFTADTHFDHNNIIIYEARPVFCFEYMVELWNRRVTDDDTIWVLGDFVWRKHDYWIPQLKGKINLLRGNHDHRRKKYTTHGVNVWRGPMYLETEELGKIKLTHVPDTTSKLLNLCGHVHGWWKRVNNCINVGVDVWNLQPVSIVEIGEYLDEHGWPERIDSIWDKSPI